MPADLRQSSGARVRTVDAVKADMKRTDAAIEALAKRFATTKD